MDQKIKVYVASSWRNERYFEVLKAIRDAGFEAYDFRNPIPEDYGFSWREIDPNWKNWTTGQYVAALDHPASVRGFSFDMNALRECDFCVLVMPCGRSAHLETGYAVGAGKCVFVLWQDGMEPELMHKMCNGGIHADLPTLIEAMEEERSEWGRQD